MVKEVMEKNRKFYVCEVCGLKYEERLWAERCETFCSKCHACSLEITRHAIKD